MGVEVREASGSSRAKVSLEWLRTPHSHDTERFGVLAGPGPIASLRAPRSALRRPPRKRASAPLALWPHPGDRRRDGSR